MNWELLAWGITTLLALVSLRGMQAAYRNGVTDGFGYAREPGNPGYAKAGKYLRKVMPYRWSELGVKSNSEL